MFDCKYIKLVCLNVYKSNLLENVELVDVGGDKAFTLMKNVIQHQNKTLKTMKEQGLKTRQVYFGLQKAKDIFTDFQAEVTLPPLSPNSTKNGSSHLVGPNKLFELRSLIFAVQITLQIMMIISRMS